MNCLGCQLANNRIETHIVYEDDYVCCILDYSPYNDGHVLILPKQHVRYFDELDDYTAISLMKASKIISKAIRSLFHPDGMTICQNGGAFDELTHFHVHVVPRYKGQNFADFYTEDEEAQIENYTKLKETKERMIEAIR